MLCVLQPDSFKTNLCFLALVFLGHREQNRPLQTGQATTAEEGRGTRMGAKPLKALSGYRASDRGSKGQALTSLETHPRLEEAKGLVLIPLPLLSGCSGTIPDF